MDFRPPKVQEDEIQPNKFLNFFFFLSLKLCLSQRRKDSWALPWLRSLQTASPAV